MARAVSPKPGKAALQHAANMLLNPTYGMSKPKPEVARRKAVTSPSNRKK